MGTAGLDGYLVGTILFYVIVFLLLQDKGR